MFDLVLPVFPKVIDPDTVGLGIHNFQKFRAKFDKLRGINEALEDGSLDPLPIVETCFGHSAET